MSAAPGRIPAAPRSPRGGQRVRFVPGARGALFEVRSLPVGRDPTTAPAVVLVAPVDEEMNRSRRLLARVRRTLGEAGALCVQVDPYGTGDSAGDFVDARWSLWCRDLESTVRGLREAGAASVSLVGLRSGALLVDALARAVQPRPDAVVLVAPEIEGERVVRRALRARVAAHRLADAGTSGGAGHDRDAETVAGLWARFERGETVELGGYSMAAPLALALRLASVAREAPPPAVREAWWIEIGDGSSNDPPASTDGEGAPSSWRRRAVRARPFWQLHDAAVSAELVDAIVQACIGHRGADPVGVAP